MLSGGKLIESAEFVPELIEPTGIQVDIQRLQSTLDFIFKVTGFYNEAVFTSTAKEASFNFNRPANIPDEIKNIQFGALAVNEEKLNTLGIGCKDFTVLDDLVKGTYLEEVINKVTEWHDKNKSHEGKVNRVHGAILSNGFSHRFHFDNHTTIRYHIAISTNDLSYMMCVDDNNIVKAVSIPADGRVWLLDTRVLHTAVNLAPNRYNKQLRLRHHLIISVS